MSTQNHGHHAGHHHEDLDWAAMAEYLEREAGVYLDVYAQAAEWIAGRQPAPARVVDVGSGPGVVACLLAERFPAAEVVAADGAAELLRHAEDLARRRGVPLTTRHVDLESGLGGLGEADLLWVGHVLHHLGDQQAALAELAGLLRPGGAIALLEGGLPSRFLPRDIGLGEPGLQSRMDAVVDAWFSGMRGELPGSSAVVEDWPAMMAAAGLEHAGTRSFLLDLPAPLGADAREHIRGKLAGTGGKADGRLSAQDLAVIERLADPDDEAGVMRRPDVFLLAARTVHLARKPG